MRMQKEVKKRAGIYAVVAVLLAIMLGTLCYNLGLVPTIQVAQSYVFKTFSSDSDLNSYLLTNTKMQSFPSNDIMMFGLGVDSVSSSFTLSAPTAVYSVATPEYSRTNVQVAGVDEADIVKSDGQYLYVVSGSNVSIFRAYPVGDVHLLSTIVFGHETYVAGIFVNDDRLVVLGYNYTEVLVSGYNYTLGYNYTGSVPGPNVSNAPVSATPYVGAPFGDVKTFVRLYDISDRTNPTSLTDFVMTGGYFNSRMTGDYVYVVIAQPSYVFNGSAVLPNIYLDGTVKQVQPTEIYYCISSEVYYYFTTIVALNTRNATEEPSTTTIMMGDPRNMYMSPSNIYVTFPTVDGDTAIYRLQVQDSNVTSVAMGTVPGHEINQYSMDEYGGYFRIATTKWTPQFLIEIINGTTVKSEGPAQINSLYVLDMNLSIVGKLENIADGENLDAARFMGDRCYLVTFIRTDPLFVIDVSKPASPEILGELNVSGFSDYLHPYDENHLIGIGKETVAADDGNFAWYQGIKVALFDVSNVSNPVQMANYTIGDRGSDSPVLRDPKAFLFDGSKDLLVIPVDVAKIDPTQYPNGVPASAYGTFVWQGAYVFNVTLAAGLSLDGTITHGQNSGVMPDPSYWVTRALYIDDVLYTVSQMKIVLNSLPSLAFLKEIDLS
jgi:inhibitor of cysteine peptidase